MTNHELMRKLAIFSEDAFAEDVKERSVSKAHGIYYWVQDAARHPRNCDLYESYDEAMANFMCQTYADGKCKRPNVTFGQWLLEEAEPGV